jgi:hypothetical protein
MGIRTKESAMPETICPQCNKPFQQGKHNQRFCKPQCKDDFHNAEKMVAYYQRKRDEVEEAEERREARLNGDAGNHKPLSEILEALIPKPVPMRRRA